MVRLQKRSIELHGHIIDSLVLPRVLDEIIDAGGEFEILHIEVGRQRSDPSHARIEVRASTSEQLAEIIARVHALGAEPVEVADVATAPAPRDGVFPPDFYATTNLCTEVRLDGRWVEVAYTEMDCSIRIQGRSAETVAMSDVRAGDLIAVGYAGIRVSPVERPRSATPTFAFMNSAISSERPKATLLNEIAQEMRQIRDNAGRILVVAGPALIHTGAGPLLERLIKLGYVQVLFGGNALATHDIEAVLYGTSLGVSLEGTATYEHGHEHHLRAINTIRIAGSIRAAVDQGILTRGIMHACVMHDVEYVLAGSIRDDGPLPDVITDMLVAQRVMRTHIRRGVSMVLMLSTMLHSIATGNLLPADVTPVVVDISPAVVTKLADRGSWQARGLVMDVAGFLNEVVHLLEPNR